MISPQLLRSYPYFAAVSAESLNAIAAIATEMEFEPGETFFQEGEPVNALYIVQQGQVDIIHCVHGGIQHVVDTVVGGELCCWSAVVEPYRARATGIARDAGRAVAIDARELRKLCEQDHTLGYHLMVHVSRALSSRLVGATLQLATAS